MKKWTKLPESFQNEEVKPYYDILKKKKISRFLKRFTDVFVSFIALILLIPFFVIIALCIKFSSRGSVFYIQERVTRYNKNFKIFKFRTMVVNADKMGLLVTKNNDNRITKVGRFLRKTKLDELPQLLNVFLGQMSFVGARPEVRKYVQYYTDEMYATLLMPSGITSSASIKYKDESSLIKSTNDVDDIYINKILVDKMRYNLRDLKEFNYFSDIKKIILTIIGK